MHSKGFAHLDMKIDNVLLDFDEECSKLEIKIADLGMVDTDAQKCSKPVGYAYGPPEIVY